MTSYAIVECGGQQYRVEKGTELVVDRLLAGEGDRVTLRPVLYRADGDVVIDEGSLAKVKVEAVVAEHLRGPKIRVFKHRPKKGYRRRAGHRSELTRLEVSEVKLLQRKPAAKKADAKPKAKAEEESKPAAKPKAEKKAPTAKKPATKKKAPAKKPAAKAKKKEEH